MFLKKINSDTYKNLMLNLSIGLVSSIVVLNLGLAMGALSGRGGFAGMVSAGLIATITSIFGGAKVGGSCPTAPMSALTAVILAHAFEQQTMTGMDANIFLNFVILLSAIFLLLFSVLKLGRLIKYVPNAVISGFMTGIALIIWELQYKKLFGIDREAIGGALEINIALIIGTFGLAMLAPKFLNKTAPKFGRYIPGTLVAMGAMTLIANLFALPIEYLTLGASGQTSLSEWFASIPQQWPKEIESSVLVETLPFAIKLALLCYIDTLLTLLIVKRMTKDKTSSNKELTAQGLSMALIGLVGGVPGAQSTVPSVLLVKEGAQSRWAGIFMGLFCLIGVFALASIIKFIPVAVISGVLIKLGWNVFDRGPFRAAFGVVPCFGPRGTMIVIGVALTTLYVDLIIAVGLFTFLYHGLNKTLYKENPIADWQPV